MPAWDTELAQLFKERNNKKSLGAITGKVINSFPNLLITILEGQVFLTNENLYATNNFITNYSLSLLPGDKILLIPTENEQSFFIIDKITKLEVI